MGCHMITSRIASSLAVALLACGPLACAPPDAPDDGALGADAQAAAGSSTPVVVVPGDGAATAHVHNGITLTLDTELTWRGGELVLRGSTSQNISSVWGFIPDDSFGTPTQLGPRSFEIAYSSLSDLDTILGGERFFIKLETTTGDVHYAAAVGVQPHLMAVAGGATTSRLVLGTPITPEPVADNPDGIHYRGTVTTTAVPQWLTVTSGGTSPTLTQDGPHAWHFDWLFDAFIAAAQSSTHVEAKAKFGATTSTRDARIAVRLTDLELAMTASPDDVWGLPSCDPAVAACLAGLPAGTVDASACGDFLQVQLCS
jgi:hypothetical protein